jgi:5-methylcytosine-specific restriction endonuclease McrA
MPMCRSCLKNRDKLIGRKCKICVDLDKAIYLRKLRMKTVRHKTKMKGNTAAIIHREYGDRFRHALFPGDEEAVSIIYRRSMSMRRKGLDITVDHVVPLYHPRVCGLHVSWNLQLLMRSENSEKGSKINLHAESTKLFEELMLKGLASHAKRV